MLATLAIRAEKYYLAGRKLIPLLDRDKPRGDVGHADHLPPLAAADPRAQDGSVPRAGQPVHAEKLGVLARGAVMAVWNG